MQNTPEWMEMRKNKIGSSDAPIIMGVSPWKTPFQLWQEKIGIAPPPPLTDSMRRGHEMEAEAREKFEEITGLTMFPEVMVHQEKPWMMASLDGIDITGKYAVEIKNPGSQDHQLALDGKVPEKYIPQLQHQIFVAQVDFIYYFSYSRSSNSIIEVKKDEKYIEYLLEKEQNFHECLEELISPDLTERDSVYREDEGWKIAAEEWLDIKKNLNFLEEREKEIRKNIIKMSTDSVSIGAGIKVSKTVRKGNIDYSMIPEISKLNLEGYRKEPTEVWRISKA